MNNKQYRQGDLLLTYVQHRPKGTPTHSLDILTSSVTGHSHTLTAGQIFVNEPNWEDNANFYVMVPEGAQLVHAEHAAITLPEGVYKVVRQREVTGYVRD